MTYSNVIAMACEELGVPFSDYELAFEVHIANCMATFKSSDILMPFTESFDVIDGRILLPKNVIKVNFVGGYMDGFDRQGRYIVLDLPLCTLYNDSECEIKYEGFEILDGDIVLPNESYARMLIAYIGWKHSRKMEKPRHIMDDYYREYVNTKRGIL
jgi:hypothetical protein